MPSNSVKSCVVSVFIQLFNSESNILRYISDSSYWIYIVHTIFLSFVPSLFYNIEMNVFLKFFINAFIVTLLCFLSYHFMVRKTFIGKLLNGKKYDWILSYMVLTDSVNLPSAQSSQKKVQGLN